MRAFLTWFYQIKVTELFLKWKLMCLFPVFLVSVSRGPIWKSGFLCAFNSKNTNSVSPDHRCAASQQKCSLSSDFLFSLLCCLLFVGHV